MLVHLLEIRKRLIYSLLCFSVLFVLCFMGANALLYTLIRPLLRALPLAQPLLATQVVAPFMTPVTLAMHAALLATAPFILLQIWCFIRPGLYPHERFFVRYMMVMSLLLFGLGVLFCFHIILPWMFQFFVSATPKGVLYQPDVNDAVGFICSLLVVFGLIFQIPLACVFAVRFQWLTATQLRLARPYVIVAAFTIGMLLTPPDVLSQLLLALPMWALYEIGLLFAHFAEKSR